MAKKTRADFPDPKEIGRFITRMWQAQASEIEKAVKSEYGLTVLSTLATPVSIKMQKTAAPMESTVDLVKAIKLAQRLIQASGGVENAVAILKAIAR